MKDTMIGDHAVVLGASMAGLLAARVLSEAYAKVTVVDRDELPRHGAHRRGVPQGHHIHGLLGRGQQALEELFPGLVDELVGAGVPRIDQLAQARLYLSGHRLRQGPGGTAVLSASRPCIEGRVRARVRALPQVSFVDRCDIVGLATSADRGRVTGTRVISRVDGSTEETLDADLVVDATGRGSRTPLWLESLGYPRPAEEKVSTDVRYVSATFRLPKEALGRDLATIIAPHPGCARGAGLSLLEGNRYILTLMGMFGDHPPTDRAGVVDFARTLPVPDIYQAIRDADPLTDPVAFHFPASVWHRYEKLPRMPDGLVVIGDAVCCFNPIYGQGMAVAALEALALRQQLSSRREPRPGKVMADFARVIEVPWDMAAGSDLAFSEVTGARSAKTRVGITYIPRLHAAAAHDAKLAATFLRVAGMLARPETLFRPDILLRVLRQSARRPASAGTSTAVTP